MALTLDPTLAAAQENISRRPLVKIISERMVPDLPMPGSLLSTTPGETDPAVITRSSGQLSTVYGAMDYSKYALSDADRTAFDVVTIDHDTWNANHSAIVELPNGKTGIIQRQFRSPTRRIRYYVLGQDGTVEAEGDIASGTYYENWAASPCVLALADGTYLLVYHVGDGGGYKLVARTSSDFVTWSSESDITIAGIGTNRIFDPSLCQMPNGDLYLWFAYTDEVATDGTERTNIYYTISTDNGSTWGSATKYTDYTDFTKTGHHPQAVAVDDTTMKLVFHERQGSLTFSIQDLGGGGLYSVADMHIDSTNRKLYVVVGYPGSGDKVLTAVHKIDIDTWVIERTWTGASVPAFESVLFNFHIWFKRHRGAGSLVPVATTESAGHVAHIGLLDGEADTITDYNFVDNPTYNLVKNVDWPSLGDMDILFTHVDLANDRLWVGFIDTYLYTEGLLIGYIDLTQGAPYELVAVHSTTRYFDQYTLEGLSNGDALILPDEDLIILTSGQYVDWWQGRVIVLQLSTGDIIHEYFYGDGTGSDGGDVNFPYNGIFQCAYVNGSLYGSLRYRNEYGQEDLRGLCQIDLTTHTVTCHRPSYETWDNYGFQNMEPDGDGGILIATYYGYGIVRFDTVTLAWEYFNNTTRPGMTPENSNEFFNFAYDPSTAMVFGVTRYDTPLWNGLAAFLLDGNLTKPYYSIGTFTTDWAFTPAVALTEGYYDRNPSIALDPDDSSLYAFWTRGDDGADYTAWGKEDSALNLSDLLVNGEDVVLSRSIDGTPTRLEFTVSHGHLFDPHNKYSLWAPALVKGRKLVVQFGEDVAGTAYWHNQGAYLVTDTTVNYEKGRYPSMRVVAEDKRVLWGLHEVIATPLYDTSPPKECIEDIASRYLGYTQDELNLPVFDASITLFAQWIDTPVTDIIREVMERFSYYPRLTVDDELSARKIAEDNAVDHTYTDMTQITRWTPDTSFSDYTNQIIVKGKERDPIEILYDEKRIGNIAGTVGWWGPRKTVRFYFSEDRDVRMRYPRMEVLESVSGIMFEMAGDATEEIIYKDPDDLFVDVEVDAPNLTPILIAAIGLYGAGNLVGDAVPFTGMTIPVGRAMEGVGLLLAMSVLGSIGNYSIDIWARPIGHVRREIQGQADDTGFQTEIGKVVTKAFEGFCTFTVSQCRAVAAQELMVCRLQRNRVRFTKLADIRDEDGDTIVIPHPYTKEPVKIFITDLTRRYRKAKNDGYFLDEIEGWVLS